MNRRVDSERDRADSLRRTLYVVATVHLDTQWRWTIQDTIAEFIPATLERNFELIERFPFFIVSFEGAFRYQLMQEYYPEQFDHLKQLVELAHTDAGQGADMHPGRRQGALCGC